jgi:two-component system phosphate regulon sensor histidine kinase PhoR
MPEREGDRDPGAVRNAAVTPGVPARPPVRAGERRADRDRLLDFYATLLAMAVHDLRQPLQVIVGAHDMLAERLSAAAERACLDRARQADARVAAMLDLLVEGLRIGMQEDGACTRPVVLEPLFRALARQFAEAARYKGIALRICRSRAVIRSNPILIDTILRNLIDNAIAYSPAGGRVLVGCRRRGAMIRIEVRDNGKGIAAEDLDKVFKAFSRLDHSRPEGLGLGLFVVRHAAALLGHQLEACSAIGRGSCFAVIAEAAMR